MARSDWQTVTGSTNNNSVFFTGIRWRYRDDLFGTGDYPSSRISSNTDIIEYQPYVGKKSNYTSNYYQNWLTSYYKYSYNTTSGSDPGTAENQSNISTTYRFDKASTNTNYYLTTGSLSSGNVMNTSSSSTSRIIQVPHCSDGTSKLRLYFYFAGASGTSFTWAETNQVVTLETIPRASLITVSDANIGSGTSIMINKASDSFTTTLRYRALKPDGTYTEWSTIVTKSDFREVYPWTVPTSLYTLIPNNRTIVCEFEATTYSEDTVIGSPTTTTATFTANVYPTINSITAQTIDQKTYNLTGDHDTIIKGVSGLQISVNATAGTGASISSYVIGGETTSSSTKTIVKASSNTYGVSVYDTRGEPPTTQSITMPNLMVEYVPLTINATISRNTPVDGNVNISFNGNYFNDTFGSQNNTLTVQYRSIEKGGSWENVSWNNLTPTISGNTYTGTTQLSNYDYTKQYEFQIRAIDEIQPKAIEGINVPKGKPIFNWDENMFNVNGNIYQNETLLSNLYLALAGGTISGNLNVTGNLQNGGNNVALASSVPTKVSDLQNDSGFTSLDIANGYSTTETAIGKWYNDETIYRKVIDFGSLPSTMSARYVDHNISNLSEIVGIKAIGYNGSDTYYPIPFASSPSMYGSTTLSIRVNATQIGIASSGTFFSGHTAIVVLEYTKSI